MVAWLVSRSNPGTRTPLELLRGLNLLLRDGSLTRAAAVLFGGSPYLEAEYSQCTLRVARFRGTTRTEFLDNRQFHGNAFELLRLGSRFLRETLPIAGRVLPGVFERVDEPLYPPEALREAIANAICHRDYGIGGGSIAIGVYDDRLEVTSSGRLHYRTHSGGPVRVPRIPPVESLDRRRIPSARHHREMGKGHDQDGGTGREGGPSKTGD